MTTELTTPTQLASGRHESNARYGLNLFQNKEGKWYYDLHILHGEDKGDRIFYDVKGEFEGFDNAHDAAAHAMRSV